MLVDVCLCRITHAGRHSRFFLTGWIPTSLETPKSPLERYWWTGCFNHFCLAQSWIKLSNTGWTLGTPTHGTKGYSLLQSSYSLCEWSAASLWVWTTYLFDIVYRPSWKITKYGGLRYHACHGSVLLNYQLTHSIDCILQSTSPMEWSDLFLNGCICALCEAFYIRRCWKVLHHHLPIECCFHLSL